MKRRDFLQLSAMTGVGASTGTMTMAALSGQESAFELAEKSVADLQREDGQPKLKDIQQKATSTGGGEPFPSVIYNGFVVFLARCLPAKGVAQSQCVRCS